MYSSVSHISWIATYSFVNQNIIGIQLISLNIFIHSNIIKYFAHSRKNIDKFTKMFIKRYLESLYNANNLNAYAENR